MRIAASSCLLLALACGGSSPPPTHYLLRAESGERAGPVAAPVRVGLGRISVAPYLAQAGLVVETEGRQVQAARQHQWAEPLDDGLRSYLRAELSAALGFDVSAGPSPALPWDYTVDVYVDRLHGTMVGEASIEASYRITPRTGAGEVAEYRFSNSAPLSREGYPGLVDAEAQLARLLAQAIAADLRKAGAVAP